MTQTSNPYRKILADLDTLVKSRFIEMFGTEEEPKAQYYPFGEVATFVNGFAFKPTDWGTEGLPIIRIQNLSGSGDSFNYYSGNYPKEIEINAGDIMVSWSATIGVFEWTGSKALLNQHIFKVFFDKMDIDPTYFRIAVEIPLKKATSLVHGSTMTHLTKKTFDAIIMPVPPKEKQLEFAAFVKQVDKSKVIVKQLIEKYDMLVKSRFIEMFGDPVLNPKGWKKNKLMDLVQIERGGSPRPIDDYITENANGLNWIKIGDAVEGSYYIDSVKEKIRPEGLKKTRQVYPGDLILSNSMSFGKPYILNIEGCIHDGWLVIRDSKDVFNKMFLCIALGFPSITHAFKGMARGAVVNNLNKDIVGALEMYIPPRDIQDQFVSFIQQVDKSKFEI